MRPQREPGRAALFAAVLVLFGCVAAFGAGERAIAERRAAIDAADAALHEDEAALDARAGVQVRRAQLAADALRENPRAAVARYLRDAARAVEARHARIVLVDAATSRSRTDPTMLRITIDGRYADVLPAVRALSMLPVPASLAISALARANPGSSNPTVSATVDVRLGVPEMPADAPRARPA